MKLFRKTAFLFPMRHLHRLGVFTESVEVEVDLEHICSIVGRTNGPVSIYLIFWIA